jgi:probable phosphoglycerate mutase
VTFPETTPRRIYLLRHGHVDTGGQRRYIGRTDLPLSPRGQAQARRLARDLAASGASRIHASDLCRAMETAQIIAAGLGLEVVTEPALREIDLGNWEGRPMAAVRREDPDGYHRRGLDFAGFRPPGGESFDDLARRVVPVFENIAAAGQGDAIIVAHAGVNRVIIADLLGMPRANVLRLGQDYGAMNVIECRSKAIMVRGVNRSGTFQ